MRTREPAWWESVVALEREGKGKEVGGRVRAGAEWRGRDESEHQGLKSGLLGQKLWKAWVTAPIPELPRNLGCIISFTATCTILSGTTLVFASSPYSAGFLLTVLFPLLHKIALQEASPLAGFLSAGPSQFSYSLAVGAESYLLPCSFKRRPLLPFRSRRLTRDDSNEFGMFMQIGSPCGPIGSGGAGTADQWGGGVGAHHVRSGLAIKGNIVSLYMGGRVGGSLASCAWSRPPPPAVPAAASSLCPRGDADGRLARRRSIRTGGAPRSLGQPGPQGQESEGPGRPGRAGAPGSQRRRRRQR